MARIRIPTVASLQIGFRVRSGFVRLWPCDFASAIARSTSTREKSRATASPCTSSRRRTGCWSSCSRPARRRFRRTSSRTSSGRTRSCRSGAWRAWWRSCAILSGTRRKSPVTSGRCTASATPSRERRRRSPAPAGRPSRSGFHCRIVWGEREIALSEGENVLGRDPETSVFIDLNSVSRRHARILVAEDSATIEDLRSRNGTYVGDKRIEQPTKLSNGDRIKIGAASLVFRCFRGLGTTQSEVSS